MKMKLRDIPVDERIRLVEDLWDSIADEQQALPLTTAQRAELDRRLDTYDVDRPKARSVADVVADISRRF